MSDLPARRFSDEEVARILKSAADLQERSTPPGEPGRGLTLEDLRQIASEAGIDPRFVELAAADAHAPVERDASVLAGGAYAWAVHRTVPGIVPEADRDRILRAIRSVMGQKGEVEDLYGRMEWSFDDSLGPVMVGVASRDGRTEIDVSARRAGEAGLLHGIGVPFGGFFGGAALAGLIGLSGAAIPLLIGGATVAGWGGLRAIWSHYSQRWERKVERLADAVASAAREVAVAPADAVESGHAARPAIPPASGPEEEGRRDE